MVYCHSLPLNRFDFDFMFQGNWKCSKCGGAITELPFQPRSEAGLTCRACFMASKGGAAAPAPVSEANPAADSLHASAPDLGDAPEMPEAPDFDPFAGGSDAPEAAPLPEDLNEQLPEESRPQKPKFQGDWKCSVCGAAITSLPFEPRSTEGLKCIDCFKSGK